MNRDLKSPCENCKLNEHCNNHKKCNAFRMWFGNEWFRVKMMFMEEEDEKTRQRSRLQRTAETGDF